MASSTASPLTSFFSFYTAATFPTTLQWHKFLQTRHNMVPHRIQNAMATRRWFHCDDPRFLVISSSMPILSVRFCARTRFPTTLRTRSPLPSTHNSLCTPLQPLLGACRVDFGYDRLRMQIACGNRMPRDHHRDIADL